MMIGDTEGENTGPVTLAISMLIGMSSKTIAGKLNGNCSPSENMNFLISFKYDFGLD